MRALGNVIWNFPFFGFVTATLFYLLGLLLTMTGIGAPIGIGLMEYGKFYYAPFGREMVSKSQLNVEQSEVWKKFSTVISLLWMPIGAFLWLGAVFQVGLMFLTIVGIPHAMVVAKSLGTIFNPVNKKCVPAAVKEELERRKGQSEVDKHLTETAAQQA